MAKDETTEPTPKKGLTRLIVLLGVIGVASLAGLAAAMAFPPAAPAAVEIEPAEEEIDPGPPQVDAEYVYYEFEAVTACLDEAQRNRYVQAKLVLSIRKEADENGLVTRAIENKKRELKSWLTIYLAGRRLEDVGGEQKLNEIKRQIRDAFNDMLWPGRRPLIDHVLFDVFKVQ